MFRIKKGDGRKAGGNRVIRGGSWNDNARNVRAAYRNRHPSDNRNDDLGFRCARAHGRMDVPGMNRHIVHGVPYGSPKLSSGGVLVALVVPG
ncbi:MAG: SUMF1/EgtB/PvdO family nonheme iron enzyme [Magnetococcales bacterium]|nr:SUMF1/EgtB/PvdO family nonheme iron enzyme [Magnetococcales bacterium]